MFIDSGKLKIGGYERSDNQSIIVYRDVQKHGHFGLYHIGNEIIQFLDYREMFKNMDILSFLKISYSIDGALTCGLWPFILPS